jgi:hypothetical protein
MSEDLFVRCCAPTLAGIKAGSMFSYPYESKEEMREDVRRLNRALVSRGLIVLPLRYHGGKALLYVYRPVSLRKELRCREAQEILQAVGYSGLCCEKCVKRLMERMQDSDEFPHEVGLFLSYPPEDVSGFIQNHARNCKFTGYWKVYGDEEKARRTFSKYKQCTDCYCRQLKSGCRLADLAVAI